MVERGEPAKASVKKIAAYWSEALSLELDASHCFVCGDTLRLARAHIKAAASGGSGAVDNLHILCEPCHTHSEPLDGDAYWRWFYTRRERMWRSEWDHQNRRLLDRGADLFAMLAQSQHAHPGDEPAQIRTLREACGTALGSRFLELLDRLWAEATTEKREGAA